MAEHFIFNTYSQEEKNMAARRTNMQASFAVNGLNI